MSHGVYALQPDTNNLSQLSVVVMPAMPNRVGGVKQGANVTIDSDGTISVPGGTVTSVGLALPAEFAVSNSPVTASGTLTATKANQAANSVYAGPASGNAAQPSFRTLVLADLPIPRWQNYTPTLRLPSGTPSSLTWNIAQWWSDGVTAEAVLDFVVAFNKPTYFHVSWPVASVGPTGWPMQVSVIDWTSQCFAYIDLPGTGIYVGTQAGSFPGGSSHFQLRGRYRIA